MDAGGLLIMISGRIGQCRRRKTLLRVATVANAVFGIVNYCRRTPLLVFIVF
jgi:hypothetical protein